MTLAELPGATWLGADRVRFDECASTNDEAARLAKAGAGHGTIVTAEAQTAGRGRGNHKWFSPTGTNLYLSCILRPALAAADCPPLTLAAGLGVWDAVSARGVEAALKWPNDVYIGNRKVAGILTEMTSRGSVVEHVVVGIGVNLNQSEFPSPLDDTATSLRIASGGEIDRSEFLEDLLGACQAWFERLMKLGVDAVRDRWNERAWRGRVQVTSSTGSVQGVVQGLGPSGDLRIVDDHGETHTIIAGEVTLLHD